MTSIIKVDQIHNSSGTSAIDISSNGILSQTKLPFFMVDMVNDQASIPDDTDTVLNFDERISDPDNIWDISNYRLTVDENNKGYWWVTVNLYSNASNNIQNSVLNIQKNGNIYIQSHGKLRASAGSSVSNTEALFSFSGIVDLTSSGDYMDIVGKWDIDSGGTATANTSSSTEPYRTYVCGYRLR